jgi:RimK family alpha-L-glutamate ligase
MKNEIFLVTNFPIEKAMSYELTQFTIEIKNAGFVPKVMSPMEIIGSISDNELPMAVLNICVNSAAMPETNIRFIRDLELRGVKVINRLFDARIADDKMLSYLELKHAGFLVPRTMDLNVSYLKNIADVISTIEKNIGFPCIIKPTASYQGIGVTKIDNINDLECLIKLLVHSSVKQFDGRASINLIVQEYIPEGNSVFRVIVLDNKCIGGELKKSNNWKTIPAIKGGERFSLALDNEIETMCIDICKLFNLKYASIDFFKNEKGYIVNEIGTMPALEVFEMVNPGVNLKKSVIEYLIS